MSETPHSKFERAVATLAEFVAEPIESKRDVAGVIQGFGMAFELAWRACQAKVSEMGYAQRGPRPSLQAAVEARLIPTEHAEAWATMLEDRNLLAHVYRPEWAIDLVARIRDEHLSMLQALVAALR